MQNPDLIPPILSGVLQTAQELKHSEITAKLIASRYGLSITDSEEWLKQTEWAIKQDPSK